MADIFLTPGGDGGIFAPGDYQAGDRLILPELATYCYIGAPKNTDADNPIIITNRPGGVSRITAGIDLTNCQGVKVTGSNDSGTLYGIVCDSGVDPFPGAISSGGHSIKGFAKDITIERTHVKNQGFGLYLKNEPDCEGETVDPTYGKANDWNIENILIQNNKFEQIYMEGIYGGSTNYPLPAGHMQRRFTCGGVEFFKLPSQLSNVKILNNIFNNTGRAAIQLSFTSGVESEVAYNTVGITGLQGFDDQGNGINFGHYTKAHVHHNTVTGAFYAALAGTGSGMELRIEDNTLGNQGRYVLIWLDTRSIFNLRKGRFVIQRNALNTAFSVVDVLIADQQQANLAGWENNVIANNTRTAGPVRLDIGSGITYSTSESTGGDRITQLHAVTPAVVVASDNATFQEAGITAENTLIVYEVGSPLKSYVPGRALNGISGFEAGKGYYIVPKLNYTVTNLLYPPIPPGSLLTMTKLKAVTKKIMTAAKRK